MSDPEKKARPKIQNPSGRWDPNQDPQQTKSRPTTGTSNPDTAKQQPDGTSQSKTGKPEVNIEDEDFSAPTAEIPPESRDTEKPGKPSDQKPL